MESVLITGASGFLGTNVVRIAKDKFEVISADLYPIEGWEIEKLDITSKKNCIEIMKKHKPDLVIHCAAIVSLAYPEEVIREVNTKGTGNIAEACKAVDAKLIYISSDWVFDGKKKVGEKYSEEDTPNPIEPYGRSKLDGEELIKTAEIEWIIVRAANIYGVNWIVPKEKTLYEEHVSKRGGLAVQTINTLRKEEEIEQPDEVWQAPTLASNIAETVIELYNKGQTGTFHISGRQCLRRRQFFLELARVFNLDESLIKPCSNLDFAKTFGSPVPMGFPENTCLDVNKVEKALGRNQLNVREGLEIMRSQFEEIEKARL